MPPLKNFTQLEKQGEKMRKINEKGEVITIGLIGAAIIIGILGFAIGASGVRKFIPGFHGNDNKVKVVSVTRSESKPIIVTGPDGKPMYLQATKSEVSNSESSEEQKLTLWQRLMILPKLWLLLMILGIFFPPVAAFMGMVNKKLMGETKKIVGGVEESLKSLEVKNPEAKTVVLDTLSKKFDSSTKALVSNIKRTL